MLPTSRPTDWTVSDHAAAQYRDRLGAPSKVAAAREIRALLADRLQLCRTGPHPYFVVHGIVLVVDPGKRRVVTCWADGT